MGCSVGRVCRQRQSHLFVEVCGGCAILYFAFCVFEELCDGVDGGDEGFVDLLLLQLLELAEDAVHLLQSPPVASLRLLCLSRCPIIMWGTCYPNSSNPTFPVSQRQSHFSSPSKIIASLHA